MTKAKKDLMWAEFTKLEAEWMRAEQSACRDGNHQEAAMCHRYRWDAMRVLQRLAEMPSEEER